MCLNMCRKINHISLSFPNHLQARHFLSFHERVQVQFRGPIASRVEAKCAELPSL